MAKNILGIYGGEVVYLAAAKCLELPSLNDLLQTHDEESNDIVMVADNAKVTYRRQQKRAAIEELEENQELALKVVENIREIDPNSMITIALKGRFIHFVAQHFENVFKSLT